MRAPIRIALFAVAAVIGMTSLAVCLPKLAPKATHVRDEHKYHGQAIAVKQGVLKSDCESKSAQYNAEGDALMKVLKAEYGYNQEAGDRINWETGEITWHVDPPPAPKSAKVEAPKAADPHASANDAADLAKEEALKAKLLRDIAAKHKGDTK